MTLYSDSQVAIALTHDGSYYAWTKHINMCITLYTISFRMVLLTLLPYWHAYQSTSQPQGETFRCLHSACNHLEGGVLNSQGQAASCSYQIKYMHMFIRRTVILYGHWYDISQLIPVKYSLYNYSMLWPLYLQLCFTHGHVYLVSYYVTLLDLILVASDN